MWDNAYRKQKKKKNEKQKTRTTKDILDKQKNDIVVINSKA